MVSFFQLFTSCLILPVYTLPFLKQLHLPYNEIWTNIKNGFACLFLGRNTVVENCGLGMAKLCDDCDGAWKTFALFSFFNICDNLITSYIIDKFSTMTYTIVSCIQGPAIAIAYYFKFLAGDVVREPRLLDFVTLVNGSRLGGGSCLGKCAHVFKLIFKEIKDNIFIYILSIIYLSVCVMNKIFAKRTLNKIGNYSFVTSETHNFICMIMFFIVYSLFGNKKGNSKVR
ncbi:chloroquine resistance transporter [Plasmodium falciparum NF54]|uniref:Chloroquine resistance transporter n=2 Tax=Plasmodium falciparum TaxID=5833 RepID=W7KIZ9_PLAFO|nr:chloroquine resistance transporter [Plasmodium falciparum NF54]